MGFLIDCCFWGGRGRGWRKRAVSGGKGEVVLGGFSWRKVPSCIVFWGGAEHRGAGSAAIVLINRYSYIE